MRKLLSIVFLVSLSCLLLACSNEETESAREIVEEGEETEFGPGYVIDNEHGQFVIQDLVTEIEPLEAAPLVFTVDYVATAKGEVSERFREILDQDQLFFLEIDVNVENQSDEVLHFDLAAASLETNLGEKVEQRDLLLSDFVREEIRPHTKVNGKFVYILEADEEAELESVRFRWPAAKDSSGQELGQEIELEVSFP